MSEDKDNIRDMVMALARGDHEAAQEASNTVMAAKAAHVTSELTEGSTWGVETKKRLVKKLIDDNGVIRAKIYRDFEGGELITKFYDADGKWLGEGPDQFNDLDDLADAVLDAKHTLKSAYKVDVHAVK